MTRHSSKLFIYLFILLSHYAYSQHEFFHEIVLEKTLIENEDWEFFGEANFKYVYNEPAWRRWGVSFVGVRKVNRFSVFGGVNGYYTFDKNITNFFEVRPWTALQYNIPIVADINLRQRLKYEWRFFYTEEDPTTRENYGRLRYQIGFDIPIPSEEAESSWTIRPFFEWFFIRDPASFERFSNERDYGVMVIKSLKNEHELSFSYKMETFYDLDTEREYGHIFLVAYSF
ncbi:MAG: DUF2490 domain-containing protein [Saprospiraceae bacterium]|nr:DUF2490 domain-containing protein [Saprospiraceae bacterium]